MKIYNIGQIYRLQDGRVGKFKEFTFTRTTCGGLKKDLHII